MNAQELLSKIPPSHYGKPLEIEFTGRTACSSTTNRWKTAVVHLEQNRVLLTLGRHEDVQD